jgi:hypothetical protein
VRRRPRRPTSTHAYHRLRLLEGITGLALGLPLVAFSIPGRDPVTPLWISLISIPPMLALVAVALHTWCRLLASELRFWISGGMHPHTAPRRAPVVTRNIAVATPVILVLLVPVPQTWVAFWFVIGVLSLAWSLASLSLAGHTTRWMLPAHRAPGTPPGDPPSELS